MSTERGKKDHDLTTIGGRVRYARELRGLTLGELGALMGQSKQSVNQYETGKRDPSVEKLTAIATHLRVSFDWLARGEGAPPGAHIDETPGKRLNGGRRSTYTHHDMSVRALEEYIKAIPVYRPMDTNGGHHDLVAQDRRELTRAYGGDTERVRRRYMIGDSMSRTIAPNSAIECVPVDRFEGPGIYYMHLNDQPIIATLQPISGGAWMIRYDNDRYMDDLLLPTGDGGFVSERTHLPVAFRVYERVVGFRQLL